MKKMLLLKKILIVLALLFLTIGSFTAQAQDRTGGAYAPSAGMAPAEGFRPSMAPTPAPPAPLDPALIGNVYGDEAATNVTARFAVATPGTVVNIAPYVWPDFPGAGAFGPDPDFFYGISGLTLDAVDATTGVRTFIGTLTNPGGSQSYTGMTYDTTTGTFYLTSCDISTSILYTVDVSTAITTPVGQITNAPCAIALAADASGNLFTYDIVADVGLSVNKATGAGTVLGPIGFDANFGQGMEYDPVTDTIYLSAFNNGLFQAELRSFNTITGSTTLIGTIGGGGTLQFGYAAIPQTFFQKDILTGNDLNFDGIPDLVVEAGITSGAFYGFSIGYFNPVGPSVTIKDIVPREWDAFWVGGSVPCSVVRADERRNLFSDNFITCYPTNAAFEVFIAQARCGDTPGDPTCHPYECGAFYLNEGAQAWVGRALMDQTDPLCLAAVKDMNGGGLDYTGAGDEDGDGVDDYTEACVNFTDPCTAPLAPPRR